jgi:hypothetical protein
MNYLINLSAIRKAWCFQVPSKSNAFFNGCDFRNKRKKLWASGITKLLLPWTMEEIRNTYMLCTFGKLA